MLEIITKKVLSYCEIPEELTEHHWVSEGTCGSYVKYSLPTQEELDTGKYSIDELDEWIIETYPELIGTDFLIELDW